MTSFHPMPCLAATPSMPGKTRAGTTAALPDWVPLDALRYLEHTEAGQPIRALARDAGCHASTVLRQIRRLENRRDDLLVDEALRRLGQIHFTRISHSPAALPPQLAQARSAPPRPLQDHPSHLQPKQKETPPMLTEIDPRAAGHDAALSQEWLHQEARRILRRMAEPGAMLAVAQDMDKAVVVRDSANNTTTRTAVVDRDVAQAMALQEWITCEAPGRIARYRITAAGRAALTGLMAAAENGVRRAQSDPTATDSAADHGAHHPATDQQASPGDTPRRRMRYCVNESPLLALARRRDKGGRPFLSDELVAAGERLREDFELSQMGPRVTQNWDRFMTAGVHGGQMPAQMARGPEAARNRIAAALRDLGPGLGDVALRCCCYLEGLETAERRMGWSARSGKIVLRIALQRLRRHYDDLGPAGAMIG